MTICAFTWSSVAAVEPDLVGQVGRAEVAVALAVLAVAGGAVLGEELLAGLRPLPRPPPRPRASDDVVRDLADLLGRQDAVNAEGRHLRVARVGVRGVADAVLQRRVDLPRACRPTASRRR